MLKPAFRLTYANKNVVNTWKRCK